MSCSVLLDTSFLIRLLNKKDPLHPNTRKYFHNFLQQEYTLKVSTISIAEYCVRGDRSDLPFKNIVVVPFNVDHAEQTGLFADILFRDKNIKQNKLLPRPLIPNDSKLFAQAHLDPDIKYFATSDTRSGQVIQTLKKSTAVHFKFLDIHTPYNTFFGQLPL